MQTRNRNRYLNAGIHERIGKGSAMKLEEMILVTENRKGTESIFLLGFPDYMEMVLAACGESAADIADTIQQLYKAKEEKKGCSELYFAGNKSCQAMFCTGIPQLRDFLMGKKEEAARGEIPVFDETRCTRECFEVLRAYGIGTDGYSLSEGFHYEPVEHVFYSGEIVKNLNGSFYRVLEILSPKNLLLTAENTGEILVGIGTQYYERTPKGSPVPVDSVIRGIEWGQGIYLGNRITNVDFAGIRNSYGIAKEEETLTQYHDRLKHEFCLYESIACNTSVAHEIREAAGRSQNAVFGTEDYKAFCIFLDKGIYDQDFCGREESFQQPKREKIR